MSESLYAEYPDAYDALYARKDYDAEVEFVLSEFEARGESGGRRALVVGCGTGEHSKRLREADFEVLGVDKYPAMVERARTKSDADLCVDSLPDLSVQGQFDLVWLPFTVVQHLRPDDLPESLRAVADRLADGGLLVFDQILTGEEGISPRLQTYPTEEGSYARLTHVHEVPESAQASRTESKHASESSSELETEYRWDSVVFTPGGEFFVDTHRLTDYDPAYVEGVCEALGLSVERYGWYDADAEPGADGHYVFVAS